MWLILEENLLYSDVPYVFVVLYTDHRLMMFARYYVIV